MLEVVGKGSRPEGANVREDSHTTRIGRFLSRDQHSKQIFVRADLFGGDIADGNIFNILQHLPIQTWR
eukprot:1647352-Rhodomonas_salina.1